MENSETTLPFSGEFQSRELFYHQIILNTKLLLLFYSLNNKNHFMKYLYNPPFIIKKIFRNFQWETGNDKIVLTFDDGPNPETTERILAELNALRIKVIFFCVGNNVKKYPSLTEIILEEGHTIGNHTFNHLILTHLDKAVANVEIDAFNNLMFSMYDYRVKYFRPPHGKFGIDTRKILNKRNLTGIMWSLITFDYKNDLNLVKFAVKKYLKKNSIIVLHDGIKSKDIIIDSINFIVEEASNKGYKFGEPAECLK